MFQGLQWMPETEDSTELCFFYAYIHTYDSLIYKLNTKLIDKNN